MELIRFQRWPAGRRCGAVGCLVAALALVVAGCSQQGNVFDLEVGVCFDGRIGAEVGNVAIVDCDGPHDNEVYAVWNVGDDGIPAAGVVEQGCRTRFDALSFEPGDSEPFRLAVLQPSEESYADGDREVVCVAAFLTPRTGRLLAVA